MTATITADELLARLSDPAYRLVRTASILLAPSDLSERHQQLESDLQTEIEDATTNPAAVANIEPIARQLADLETEIDSHRITFKFGALPRRAWVDLLAAHPPTKEQVKQNDGIGFNPDTFPAAAIAACLIDPVMTPEQVQTLEHGVDGAGGLADAQFNVLFNTAVAANLSGLTPPTSAIARIAAAKAWAAPTWQDGNVGGR